jgi:hypothetical protein
MQFDVVDLRALRTTNAGGGERLANLPGEKNELVKVRFRDSERMLLDQKKPVAAPGNVAGHRAESGNIDMDGSGPSVAGNIFKGHSVVFVQRDSHDADRCLYAVGSGLDPAKISERGDDADGSVPAHAQAPAVVEENDARNTIRASGLAEQRAYDCFRGTRFSDQSPAEGFVFFLKQKAALLQVAASKVRAAFNDGSGRLTAGV